MDRQRLDKWLWHARVVKTRTDAAALVAKGRVRINGARQTSPGHAVKDGDVLTIA
ncbi:MAG: RNA-binding S4 domain-containing protein, partial [Afipia sp.]|nr:RNA-binding S4 domain-containing protein [Afipia sp.]